MTYAMNSTILWFLSAIEDKHGHHPSSSQPGSRRCSPALPAEEVTLQRNLPSRVGSGLSRAALVDKQQRGTSCPGVTTSCSNCYYRETRRYLHTPPHTHIHTRAGGIATFWYPRGNFCDVQYVFLQLMFQEQVKTMHPKCKNLAIITAMSYNLQMGLLKIAKSYLLII